MNNLIGQTVRATIPSGFDNGGCVVWKQVSGIVAYVERDRIILRDGTRFYSNYLN